MRQIANNAGTEGAMVLQRVKGEKGNTGFDANSGEYVNMVDKGIIDPTKVTRIALQNAASVAALLLTTEALITELPEENKPAAPMPGGLTTVVWVTWTSNLCRVRGVGYSYPPLLCEG